MPERYDEFGHEMGTQNTFVKIKVAGVTFRNGRRFRQTILRKIYWKDEPYQRYDDEDCIDLVPVLFEGSPAVEVWFKNKKSREQIGYIPKSEAEFFYNNMYRYDGHFGFEVYGGGIGANDEKISFGASFTARFKNREEDILHDPVSDSSHEYSPPPEPTLHQRAFDIFRRANPRLENCSYVKMSSVNKTGVLIYVSGKFKYTVTYDHINDLIKVFDTSARFLYEYPLKPTIFPSPIPNSNQTSSRHRSGCAKPVLFFLCIPIFILLFIIYLMIN